MIAETLDFLRKRLDGHLALCLATDGPNAAPQPKVVFVKYEGDAIKFEEAVVSVLLLNIEEERTLRAPDLHARQAEDGSRVRACPELRLILYLLFVARFREYTAAWKHLSLLIEHLQSTPVLDPQTAPDLPAGIEKLVLELVTLSLAEQNEVWSALRSAHQPALLYRVKLLAYRDRQAVQPAPAGEIQIGLRRLP